MSVLPIKTKGDPILRQKCAPVDVGVDVSRIVRDMLDTARAKNGIGLAANQVGIPLRIIIVAKQAFINPEITKASGVSFLEEGCLSIPGKKVQKQRANSITVRYEDECGLPHKVKARDLIAHVFQHEIDHLDGVLMDDYQYFDEAVRQFNEDCNKKQVTP